MVRIFRLPQFAVHALAVHVHGIVPLAAHLCMADIRHMSRLTNFRSVLCFVNLLFHDAKIVKSLGMTKGFLNFNMILTIEINDELFPQLCFSEIWMTFPVPIIFKQLHSMVIKEILTFLPSSHTFVV